MTQSTYQLEKGSPLGRNYRVLEFLGNGFEGEVYKVEERQTGILRTAKLFYKHPAHGKNPHVAYAKKLFNLRSCPIVIQYHNQDLATIKKESVHYLISEFADGEVLSSFIDMQPQKRLMPFEALHLLYALAKGIEQIHLIGEYHGDIHCDNIILLRKGLGFDIKLIDVMHLGRSSKAKIQTDVYDLISVFFEMLGGQKHYSKLSLPVKQIILGRKKSLIKQYFNHAGHLRAHLENMLWD